MSEPVWPRGKGVRLVRPQFESASALLPLQKLWSVGHCLVTVSITIN